MTLIAGCEDTGALPLLALSDLAPFVRTREDVPHEGALADLYGLGDEELACLVEAGVVKMYLNLTSGEVLYTLARG